jgi:uncharacterized protein (TIGR00251 family)
MMKETNEGLVFGARIKTGSKRFALYEKSGLIMIDVTSPPKENRANMEIIRELKRVFSQDVRILRGLSSREKLILVSGICRKDFERKVPGKRTD